jgi:predicted anti-sigma-YlaC factor YlaD
MDPFEELSCQELVELVTGYLDDSLPAHQRTLFEEHLVMCEWCCDYLDQFERTIAMTGGLREADLSDTTRAALMSAFRGWKAERG